MTRRIFITVAEVSGDKHAAQLIRELRALDPTIVVEGLGGAEMEAAGAVIHRNTVIKAAMGWRGLLRAFEVYKLLRFTEKHFDSNRPDLWIGVDSPSMNFHFARIAHDRGIPTLQYVAPQLWAWAIWRMKKLRRWVDQVACILPFEGKFFGGHGVNAVFVGHPLFDELPPRSVKPPGERFPNRPPVIGLLAGSRKSEAVANFPGMLRLAARVKEAFPQAVFLAPTTDATHPIVTAILNSDNGQAFKSLNVQVGLGEFDALVPQCDLCITVSGTATLHVASFNVPMIVVYRVSPLTWNLAGRWLVPTRTIALVNVLAKDAQTGNVQTREGHIVPEFLPWSNEREVIDLALDMLNHPEKLEAQRADLSRLISSLDHPGASGKVAKMAIQMIDAGKRANVAPLFLTVDPRNEEDALAEIDGQLSRRAPAPEGIWRTPTEARLARELGDLCAELAGWPRGRFYPDDPFGLMLVEDMADVDVGIYLENTLKIDLPVDSLSDLSFGEAISRIAERFV